MLRVVVQYNTEYPENYQNIQEQNKFVHCKGLCHKISISAKSTPQQVAKRLPNLLIAFQALLQILSGLKGSVTRVWDGPNLVSEERSWEVRAARIGFNVDRCVCTKLLTKIQLQRLFLPFEFVWNLSDWRWKICQRQLEWRWKFFTEQ